MAGSEWKEVELGQVAEEITVGFVGTMKAEYVDDGFPFLRSQNVEPYRINTVDLKYIGEAFHRRIKKSRLRPGDVVIVRTGKPGTAAVIPDWLEDANCSDLVIVRPGRCIDPRFLAYYVNSAAKGHVDAHTVGAVQQHFNVGSAKEMVLLLPPLEEQQQIARILGTLDDKIELNRRMNATLEGLARAMFQSWFVDFDPVVAKAAGRRPVGMDAATAALFPDSFMDSPLGPFPKGWAIKDIYSVSQVVYGAPFASALFNSGGQGMPLLRIRDLADHNPEVFTTEVHPKGTVVTRGDIVVGMDGEFRGHIWRGPDSLLNQRMCKFIPTGEVPAYFVLFSIEDDLAEVERSEVGTTVIHLGKADIDTFTVVLPPDPVLRAFKRIVDSLFGRFLANAQQTPSLITLRDALLPRLLSGELRLRDAERVVGEVV